MVDFHPRLQQFHLSFWNTAFQHCTVQRDNNFIPGVFSMDVREIVPRAGFLIHSYDYSIKGAEYRHKRHL